MRDQDRVQRFNFAVSDYVEGVNRYLVGFDAKVDVGGVLYGFSISLGGERRSEELYDELGMCDEERDVCRECCRWRANRWGCELFRPLKFYYDGRDGDIWLDGMGYKLGSEMPTLLGYGRVVLPELWGIVCSMYGGGVVGVM